MTEPEIALAAIDPGYRTASTASRLDAFLLPDASTLPNTTPSRRRVSATPSGSATSSTCSR